LAELITICRVEAIESSTRALEVAAEIVAAAMIKEKYSYYY
jgi:hypothetical protein